jgi:hypothetical protein
MSRDRGGAGEGVSYLGGDLLQRLRVGVFLLLQLQWHEIRCHHQHENKTRKPLEFHLQQQRHQRLLTVQIALRLQKIVTKIRCSDIVHTLLPL